MGRRKRGGVGGCALCPVAPMGHDLLSWFSKKDGCSGCTAPPCLDIRYTLLSRAQVSKRPPDDRAGAHGASWAWELGEWHCEIVTCIVQLTHMAERIGVWQRGIGLALLATSLSSCCGHQGAPVLGGDRLPPFWCGAYRALWLVACALRLVGL